MLDSRIDDLCRVATSEQQLLDDATEMIEAASDSYSWVGIYVVSGDELILASWKGPQATQHVRIPLSLGICGLAATGGETVVVDDVNADPRYLACFAATRSEIVVPIKADGNVLAEIDIDSNELAAFSGEDRAVLEKAADSIGRRLAELRG